MYLAFSQACTNDKYYDKTAHAQTDPHVSIWRQSAFGGNLRVRWRAIIKMIKVVIIKIGSWGFEGTIILIILFSKLLESTFYKEISKFQQKV